MMELRALEAEFRARMHKALKLDGVDDFIDCGNSALFDFDTGKFTITVWAYSNGDLSDGRDTEVVGKEPDPGSYFEAYSMGPYEGKWRVVVRDSNRTFHTISVDAQDYVWYMWSAIWDGSTLYLYKNDKLEVSTPLSSILKTTGNFRIGVTKNKYFNGLVSLVYVYDIDLSESEVRHLYYNPFDPPEIEHLVLWLAPSSIDLANGKWWDLSSKGNHGIIYGCNEVLLTEPEVVVV